MKSLIKITVLALVMIVFTNSNIKANGLVISGASVNLAGAGTILTFTISWENSWMTAAPNNWDAVWVYAKYQDCTNPTVWNTVKFSTGAGHSIAGGVLQVDPVSDGMGVFIRRIAIGGPGNIAPVVATLTMTTPAGGTAYNFKVFGTEMVRITPEDFQIGDGTSTSTFNSITITSNIQNVTGLGAAALYGGSPAVPTTFPMGRNDFYCMKYEVTNEQYVDFLNCLDYTQQQTRTEIWPNIGAGAYVMYTGVNRNRCSIVISTSGVSATTPAVYANNLNGNGVYNEAADGLTIACGFLSWGDLTAWLDWSGLRPMTDIEFEKICRGPIGRLAGEYVWGNISATQAGANVCIGGGSNWGTVSELPLAGRNCQYSCASCNSDNTPGYGPLRAGALAAANPTRIGCGAAYYGVMEMAGSLFERIVAMGAAATFTGALGDGVLDANGDANVASWPDPITAANTGYRGGSWTNSGGNLNHCRTSDRQYALTVNANRMCYFGGRGVR